MKLGGMGTRTKLLLDEFGDVMVDPVEVATDCEGLVGDLMVTAGTIVTAGLGLSAGFLRAAIFFC